MNTLNPLPKPEAEKLIERTVELLDRYGKLYEQLSGGRLKTYLDYFRSGGFGDEDEFIKPKLFTDFLREVLGFPRDEYSPERSLAAGVPDFQPRDALLHDFFFEVKPSNAVRLDEHEEQVRRYLKPPFRFGVLTNMRDIIVYDIQIPGPALIVNLLQLYYDRLNQPRLMIESPNTRKFLEFLARFRYQPLDRKRKVELISRAPNWDPSSSLIDPEGLIAAIHRVVGFLVEDARRYKQDIPLQFSTNPQARSSLIAELDEIARELDRRYVAAKEDRLARFLKAREGSLEHRAFEVFLARVAYYTMTKILIARMWEDVGFLPQRLYDGGFAEWYQKLGEQVQEVLRLAFSYAAEKYSWLYGEQHNYFWYNPPSEDVIVDVLYEFARFDLGKLDTDVLGTVYERFVDQVNRKNKGQYYTPREIVRFIWDRVGFTNEDDFFRHEDGKRQPTMILDVATGSGGFLVEAARRIRTQTRYDRRDANELLEVLSCIYQGLCGCEISMFAHYITEVNLLIQLTPLIRHLVETKRRMPPFMLYTIPGDSLGLAEPPRNLFNGTRVSDQPRSILGSNPKSRMTEQLQIRNDFDYVCSNPPYLGEKGHKELFRTTRADYPFWEKHYQGKMDYLYWFIILGLRKLREGGKLGFITTSYWPTADGASHLREFILENALIHEVVDLGETRIFGGAPGQHDMVFVLEKCSNQMSNNSSPEGVTNKTNVERKQKHYIKVVKVKAVPPPEGPEDSRNPLTRVVDHIARNIGSADFSDDYLVLMTSTVAQSELGPGAWNFGVDLRTRSLLAKIAACGAPLTQLCSIDSGIQSSADKVSSSNIRLLSSSAIQQHSIRVGAGIFVISRDELENAHLTADEMSIIKPFSKSSDIDPYFIGQPADEWLLNISAEVNLAEYPNVALHLSRYRPILENRRECDEGKYPWYRLHRPRAQAIFEGRKIVNAQRANTNVFAYHEGSFYASVDVYFTTVREGTREDLKYVCGILNSRTMLFWLDHKCKKKGAALELYFKPLSEIPIRRIDFGDQQDVKRHDRIVKLVDEMIETKQKLSQLNRYFHARLTRLSVPDELPEPDVEAITSGLPGSDLLRVRNHPEMETRAEMAEDFVLARLGDIENEDDIFSKPVDTTMLMLRLFGKGRRTIDILAPKEILEYLRRVLNRHIGMTWDQIKEIPIAEDLTTYRSKEKEIVIEARTLLHKVESLQHKIDAIVYDLYGLTAREIDAVEGK